MSNSSPILKTTHNGFTAAAYRGDGSVLLAFSLKETPTAALAGFAIRRTPPKGAPQFLLNRLSFTQQITSETTPAQRKWTPSDKAPFQKFRWVDFPPEVLSGTYQYDVTAMLFKKSGGLDKGESVRLAFGLQPESYSRFEMGFTRGYLSSQAYADRFKNAPFRPAGPKTIDYDTKPYAAQYDWLGFHARKMLFAFLNETVKDPALQLDVFAYDLDEPDLLRLLAKLGPRGRFFLDDADLHTGATAAEPKARALLEQSAGAGHVRVGHFKRFAHNKVLIQRRGGKPVKVLTGSANFSVRGLYVQANNVLVFDDPKVAKLYADAFDQAFQDPTKTQAGFPDSKIASQWWNLASAGCPRGQVAFSPHRDAALSLDPVTQAVKAANSSVMFAIMEMGGSGSLLGAIRSLDSQNVFSYGVTQGTDGLKFFKPGSKRGQFAAFAYLRDKVPAPFKAEWSGGQGQVVHHKFVVVDFNDTDPIVFTGSSNLAAGGEESNGDNLLAIPDRGIATAYGVEAVRLLDHYQFRLAMQAATTVDPLVLAGPDAKKKWWADYYVAGSRKFNDRVLFAKP